MIKAVVFDLDDTLAPEILFIKSGFFEVAKKISSDYFLEINECYQKLFQLFTLSFQNVFNRFFEDNKLFVSKEYILSLVKKYREHVPLIQYYDDVLPTILTLKKRKLLIGIISDGFLVSQENKIKALNAKQYFDSIVLTDKLGKDFWKPNPKPFELIANQLNIKLDEMIYVGDNPEKDFYISKTHNLCTVRIRRNEAIHRDNEYYNGVTENYSINDLHELIKLVDKLNEKQQ